MTGGAAITSAGVVSHRAVGGGRRWAVPLPWGPLGQLLAVDELDESKLTGPLLLAAGPGGALAMLDQAGTLLWQLEADGTAVPSLPQLVRGVAITAASGLRLCDALGGVQVAQVGGPRAPALWASAPDLTLALCEGGELAVHRLATHLSLV